MNNPNEQNSTSLTGIGSMCYIILKDDLQPDTLTPKEGKQWHEIDLRNRASVQVGSAATTAAPVPSASPECFRQSFTMTGEVQLHGNWTYRPPRPPHFRRRRLHIKFVNKLARHIAKRDDVPPSIMREVRHSVIDEIISSRKSSHNLNRAIKKLKQKKYDYTSSQN